jgi:hypothetical protein
LVFHFPWWNRIGLTGLMVLFATGSPCRASGQTESIAFGESAVRLNGPWRFQTGDDPSYARPDFNDSSWETIDLAPLKGREAPLTGDSYRPGWTGSGHGGYHGYAWYRLHIHLAQRPAQPLKLIMPTDVDDGYEVYVNGTRLLQFGDFSVAPPRVYLSNQVVAAAIPPSAGQDLTFAIRFWMSAWTAARYPNSGGLHREPALGLAPMIGLIAASMEYSTFKLVVISCLKSLVLLILAALAIVLYWQDRSQPLGLLLAIASLLEVTNSAVTIVGANTYVLPMFDVWRVQNVVLPLGVAVWSLLWFHWFELQRYRWLAYAVSAAGIAMIALAFLRYEPLFNPGGAASPVVKGAFAAARVVQAALFLVIVGLGIRRRGLANWPALAVAGIRAFELVGGAGLWQVTTTWFPGGFRVQLLDVSAMLSVAVLSILLALRLNEQRREKQRMAAEFEAARGVQQLLLSGAAPPSRHYGVEAVYLPAREVGGDLYYWLPDDNGGFTLVVGDVSGKGLQAALQVSLILGALRETGQRQPGRLLSRLNAVALGQMGGGFVTCCCMHFSESGTVALANAGHLAPYCRGREVETPGALPLGIVADASWPETVFTLGSDDQITVLSDGVVEAVNSRRELFGFGRAGEISKRSASEIAEAAHTWGQQDDITVVTVRRRAGAEQPESAAAARL